MRRSSTALLLDNLGTLHTVAVQVHDLPGFSLSTLDPVESFSPSLSLYRTTKFDPPGGSPVTCCRGFRRFEPHYSCASNARVFVGVVVRRQRLSLAALETPEGKTPPHFFKRGVPSCACTGASYWANSSKEQAHSSGQGSNTVVAARTDVSVLGSARQNRSCSIAHSRHLRKYTHAHTRRARHFCEHLSMSLSLPLSLCGGALVARLHTCLFRKRGRGKNRPKKKRAAAAGYFCPNLSPRGHTRLKVLCLTLCSRGSLPFATVYPRCRKQQRAEQRGAPPVDRRKGM